MEETPEFDAAVRRLQRFLTDNGWPSTISWRRTEDVVRLPDGDVVVRRRPSFAAEEFARTYYEDGRQRGLGVALEVPCEVEGAACTTIYWTTDTTEAEYRLMPDHGLKMVIATPHLRARAVGALRWWLAARRANVREAIPHATVPGDAAEPRVAADGAAPRR